MVGSGAFQAGSVLLAAALAGFVFVYQMTYRPALRRGQNSLAMVLAGRKGCMLMSKALALLAGKNPEQVRARMRQEGLEAIALARQDEDSREPGAICFVGSSTFTFWSQMKRDLCPLRCVNLAFGGSATSDLMEHVPAYAEFEPKVIVYYCGTNDLSMGRSVEDTVQGFIDFATEIRKRLPDVGILYLSISLTPFQQYLGNTHALNKANESVTEYIQKEKFMAYLDITKDANFTSNLNWYLNDGLHLNNLGHVKLGEVLRPAIERLLREVDSDSAK